jgi:hypothetical protein
MGGVLNPINFVTGTLGCGKSYYSVKHIFRYLSEGKRIACNFDLLGDFWNTAASRSAVGKRLDGAARHQWGQDCRERAMRFDNMDDLYQYRLPGSGEDRGLLVFDEAGLNLNRRMSRQRSKADEQRHENPLAAMQFYINMRKRGWTCLIIAHSAKHLDDQVQDLGGSIIRLRNFSRVKMPIIGVSLTKEPRFLAIHFWPEVRTITKREFYGLDKKIARHYRSMDEFEWEPKTRGLRHQISPGRLGVLVGPPDMAASPGAGAARSAGAHGAERVRDAAPDGTAPVVSDLDAWLAASRRGNGA